jgi:hypothetical protein
MSKKQAPSKPEYDVAVSFAGEDRKIVEQFVEYVRQRGVKVFYDDYERDTLWGKDLYQHLDDVYRHRARYCVIFVSESYAKKLWTRHELKSAQARAFQENQEYILPVRLDDTEIPGVRPTTGYQDLRSMSVEQVAELLLKKLNRAQANRGSAPDAAPASKPAPANVDSLALLRDREATERMMPCSRVVTSGTVQLTLHPDAPADTRFLGKLRERDELLVAYGTTAVAGRVAELSHVFEKGNKVWSLTLEPVEQQFGPGGMEPSTSNLSADEIAVLRARRILFNEGGSKPRRSRSSDPNDDLIEMFVRGMSVPIEVESSPFPQLYQELQTDIPRFLAACKLTAVLYLCMTGTIESVDLLEVRHSAGVLKIQFEGTRHRRYSNMAPYVMNLVGECQLP